MCTHMSPAVEPTRDLEDTLFARGVPRIYAVDEVGRGAISGDASVGITVFTPDLGPHPDGLRDSKLISEKKRPLIAAAVRDWIPVHAVGSATADEIDTVGITKALALAGMRALSDVRDQLTARGEDTTGWLLLDGSHNWLGTTHPYPDITVITRVKADRDCVSVAAASVLAKVDRDQKMVDLALIHPHYAWEKNKGYGAPAHYAGLQTHGPVPGIHRLTWL